MGYMDSAGGRPGQAPDRVVYLDHAATTPLLPEALSAMTEELGQLGNPSSLHNAGRRARRVVEESREQIAEVFGARPSEVIFTGGGTEADNLAVKGLYWARQGGRQGGPGKRRRVLTTAVEHHAVLDSVHWLTEHEAAQQALLPVDPAGALRPGTLADAIDASPGTVALVTVMWANNEVGTVQPIAELAEIAREHGIPFHTDAVQAAGQLPVSFAASGADAMTVTAHKFGGPVGAGALLLARGVQPVPVLHGGGQESEVRSGTLDAPAIRAFAVAAAVMAERRADEAARLAGLRDDLIRQVMAAVPGRHPERPARRAWPAARQRALLLPGLRGRRAADAARRQGHRLLHRLGVHRRGGPAQPRAAGHGRGRGPGPWLAALLARPHHHRAGRGRARRGDRRGRPAGPPRHAELARGTTPRTPRQILSEKGPGPQPAHVEG